MSQRTARALARLVGPSVFALALMAGTVWLGSALNANPPAADGSQLAAAPAV